MHQGVEFLTVDRMALPFADMEVESDRPDHNFAGVDIEQRQVLQELFLTELVHRLHKVFPVWVGVTKVGIIITLLLRPANPVLTEVSGKEVDDILIGLLSFRCLEEGRQCIEEQDRFTQHLEPVMELIIEPEEPIAFLLVASLQSQLVAVLISRLDLRKEIYSIELNHHTHHQSGRAKSSSNLRAF